MSIATINPTTGKTLKTFESLTDSEIEAKLTLADKTFKEYRKTTIAQRSRWLNNAADILEKDYRKFAKLITIEMGKPIKEAIAEIQKCTLICRFYAENTHKFLRDVPVATDASRSFVRYQPLGIILAVMPWNFPFWQVFRFAAPALMSGNVGILKHASNVPQCALTIEVILKAAEFPAGAFQTFLIGASQVEAVMADERVKAGTLTGSEPAGASFVSTAGKNIKKTVLELGGSDPFIVLDSANIEAATTAAVTARMLNNGQSCIAAKRLIVVESVAGRFEKLLVEKFQALKMGDPMSEEVDIGPLATPRILQDIDQQVQETVTKGAKILIGGQPTRDTPGNFYPPTILKDIPVDSPGYSDEFFGPVALLFRVEDIDKAIELANSTIFGLGASGWTNDPAEQERLVEEIEAGCVFINSIVKSDPRLPFGGIKRSGYGRELSIQGIREFVNVKTIWIN
ncbi:MAG: NAD-dependent succinate-semialdehyde dehydrogenase [cyanobacterium endosymbiont of Rhopalodia musculus]|uniref:NAD-dependent succinate-semialdehyde dehydrogenase n=1 Tax=cyanobacterium endosymbiont of Epithemia clementina EcSB TaxID=3034674 RepID=UPI00247FF5C0|nr:NAD-dependent succinate-semialdehyde dehydrogenase [cyanobacterium endosymbiont of Epithemia clementina EcSB]WGT67739.1 NAD-dependent succinate-semialdehyde dehydrogenase [cyanobacterium endosymbiont of Epithemia clementina EcSB]